jgi:putative acetyltransferase
MAALRIRAETGSQFLSAPALARALQARCGVDGCAPFGSYGPDPASHFMTRLL